MIRSTERALALAALMVGALGTTACTASSDEAGDPTSDDFTEDATEAGAADTSGLKALAYDGAKSTLQITRSGDVLAVDIYFEGRAPGATNQAALGSGKILVARAGSPTKVALRSTVGVKCALDLVVQGSSVTGTGTCGDQPFEDKWEVRSASALAGKYACTDGTVVAASAPVQLTLSNVSADGSRARVTAEATPAAAGKTPLLLGTFEITFERPAVVFRGQGFSFGAWRRTQLDWSGPGYGRDNPSRGGRCVKQP